MTRQVPVMRQDIKPIKAPIDIRIPAQEIKRPEKPSFFEKIISEAKRVIAAMAMRKPVIESVKKDRVELDGGLSALVERKTDRDTGKSVRDVTQANYLAALTRKAPSPFAVQNLKSALRPAPKAPVIKRDGPDGTKNTRDVVTFLGEGWKTAQLTKTGTSIEIPSVGQQGLSTKGALGGLRDSVLPSLRTLRQRLGGVMEEKLNGHHQAPLDATDLNH